MVLLGLAAWQGAALGRMPVVTKLYERKTLPKEGDHFSTDVAVSERWLLAGAEELGGGAALAGRGTVYVHDAVTGRYLRTLSDPNGQINDRFGGDVAVCGNLALIGASRAGASKTGEALLFNLLTGKVVWRLSPSDGVEDDLFGSEVALGDRYALVSSARDAGAVYVFDVATGAQLAKFVSAEALAGSGFGTSLALAGRLALIGAPGQGGKGAAYLYDLDQVVIQPAAAHLHKYETADGVASDRFGESVGMSGGRVLIGAPAHANGKGAAYLFDAATATPLVKFFPADLADGDGFGRVAVSGNLGLVSAPEQGGHGSAYLIDLARGQIVQKYGASDLTSDYGGSVALCGNTVVIGAPGDSTLASDAGAAYLIRPVGVPLPMVTLAQTRDTVPGVPVDTEFRAFGQPVMNGDGEVTFLANLSGEGSNRNRDVGLYTNQPGLLTDLARTRNSTAIVAPGTAVAGILGALSQQNESVVMDLRLSGTGVTQANNRVILSYNGTEAFQIRTGVALNVAPFNGAVPLTFPQVLQTWEGSDDRLLLPYRFQLGTAGVDADDDTGVFAVTTFGGVITDINAREGLVVGPGRNDTYGEFLGRAATGGGDFFAFSAFMRPENGGPAVQEAFTRSITGGAQTFSVARQGAGADFKADPKFNNNLVNFRTMLGESLSGDLGLVRATVTVTGGVEGIREGFTEGLWREELSPPSRLALRRGEPITVNGPRVDRILAFWPAGDGVVVLVKCFGTGVGKANDCALLHLHLDAGNQWQIFPLMREGDAVADWDCPKVAAIQRVEVEPISGHFAVLASLTGSKGRNQALFIGSTGFGDHAAKRALRLPYLALRKGTLYNTRDSESTRLLSIDLRPVIDPSGAGGKGRGQVMSSGGELVLSLAFDNGARELVQGRP